MAEQAQPLPQEAQPKSPILLRPAIKSRLHGIRSPLTLDVSPETPAASCFASDRTDTAFLQASQRRYFPAAPLTDHLRCTKPVLSLWVAAVSLTATVLAQSTATLDGSASLVALLVLALAAGGATLNNVQDRHLDRLVRRTRQRPLAAGTMAPAAATWQAIGLISGATAGLAAVTGGWTAPLLGLAGILLYNGLYTPLKKRTVLALVPGAVAGALPAAIGWAAGGASFAAPALWLLLGLLVVWQLPHVWLLQLASHDPMRCHTRGHETRTAAPSCAQVPSLLDRLPAARRRRLTALVMLGFAGLAVLGPQLGLVTTAPGRGTLLALVLVLTAGVVWLAATRRRQLPYLALFHAWNGAIALLLVTVLLDRLWPVT